MKIHLSKKEYKDLLDMIYISSWVIHAFETQDKRPNSEEYSKLEQGILSYAEKLDFGDLVIWDDELKEYFFTDEMDDDSRAREIIDEYDNDTFWDELERRLAKRDFINEYGIERIKEMSTRERIEKQFEFEKKYNDEFVENGLDNLNIDKD